jgi:hypothetical protein
MLTSHKSAADARIRRMRLMIRVLLPAAVFLLCLGVTESAAQISSANYRVTSGTLVAGGHSSGSTNYKDVGAVPLTGVGVSSSSNYTASGGVIGITFGTPTFTAAYAGAAVETITKLDKVLKVSYLAGPTATTGTFYYRNGGATSYQMGSMTAGTGDTLVYTVPASLLGVRGLEYYFLITQGTSSVYIGNQTDPYVFIVQLTDEQAQRPTALTATKYRIIGVPISFSVRNPVTTVFDELGTKDITKWRLFSYNTTADTVLEYPDAAEVIPGRGYWLIMRSPVSYGAAGFSMRPNRDETAMDYYEVSLDNGWNLISNPLPFNVVWSEVRFDTGGVLIGHSTAVIDDSAYWYNGSAYVTVETVPAWDGFFLLAKRAGVKILFPYHENTAPTDKTGSEIAQSSDPGAWNVELKIEADGSIDDANFAGVRSDAQSGDDEYDYSEPPPAPGAPTLAFRLPDGAPRLRRADYRPPFTDGSIWNVKVTTAAGGIITPAGLDGVPEGMIAVLTLDNGTSVQLAEGKPVPVSEKVKTAQLVIGTREYLAQGVNPLPTTYALDQNYPNPFNPITSIHFAVPKPGHVNLSVYNILGQLVKALVNRELTAGEYTVEWDGADEDSRPVASGIYFYRMTAGPFSECRKMILLK